MNLCGDPTCTNYACSQEALDAWVQRGLDAAKAIVRPWACQPETTIGKPPTDPYGLGHFDRGTE